MAPKKASSTAAKPAAPTAADFSVGDVVLTKIKGYPDWPSKVRQVARTAQRILMCTLRRSWITSRPRQASSSRSRTAPCSSDSSRMETSAWTFP